MAFFFSDFYVHSCETVVLILHGPSFRKYPHCKGTIVKNNTLLLLGSQCKKVFLSCLRYRFFLSFWLNNTTAVTVNTKARGTPHIKYPLSPVSITNNGMHSNERRPVPRRRINR